MSARAKLAMCLIGFAATSGWAMVHPPDSWWRTGFVVLVAFVWGGLVTSQLILCRIDRARVHRADNPDQEDL